MTIEKGEKDGSDDGNAHGQCLDEELHLQGRKDWALNVNLFHRVCRPSIIAQTVESTMEMILPSKENVRPD